MNKCIECGKRIPKARLLALPGVQTCIKCSNEKLMLGMPDQNTSEIIIVDAESIEQFKRRKNESL